MSQEAQTYLEEVFGYTRVEEIDELTLDCIRENAEAGYLLDEEILDAHLVATRNDIVLR